MIDLKKLIRVGNAALQKNAPAVLTGLGVTGLVSTTILGCHATVKSVDTLYVYEENQAEHYGDFYKADIKEKIALCWKYYIPTFLAGGVSIACIISAQSVNQKRYAALASLYSLSETALSDYKKEAAELLKNKDLLRLEDGVAEKKMSETPLSENYIIETGNGDHLFFDCMSARYFRTDIETVRRIQNNINADLVSGKTIFRDLNDFYYELGLEGVKYGDEMGWDAYQPLDIQFTSKICDDGQNTCMVIDYHLIPRYM